MWKKTIVVFCGIAAIPASIFAGALAFDIFDRRFLSGGRIWNIEGANDSLGVLLYTLAFAFAFLVPCAAIWIRVYRGIESRQVKPALGGLKTNEPAKEGKLG